MKKVKAVAQSDTGMSIVRFKITGFPHGLLTNNPASMESGNSGGLGTKKIKSAEEKAAAGAYRDKAERFVFPANAFRQCAAAGAAGRRIAKRSAPSVIRASVFAAEDKVLLLDPSNWKPLRGYEIDTRRVVLKSGAQKVGIPQSRPLFKPWGCFVEFEYDAEIITPELILDCLRLGGRQVGVGDYRPEKGGPFGRFTVEIA